MILHGEVSASFAFSHLIFFHDSRAFRPFSPRRMKIKKFVGLSSRRSWWFVGRGNKVREKKLWAALRARKKRKQEQTTFRGNQYRWGFEFSVTKVLLGEKVNGWEERVPPQFPCLSIIRMILSRENFICSREKKKKRIFIFVNGKTSHLYIANINPHFLIMVWISLFPNIRRRRYGR